MSGQQTVEQPGQMNANGAAPLPAGWTSLKDPETGKVFYQNSDTKQTSWERPGAILSGAMPVPAANESAPLVKNAYTVPPVHDDPMCLSVFTCLCCCFPLGLWAIIVSSRAKRLFLAGQTEEARAQSLQARTIVRWAICLGVITIVTGVVAAIVVPFMLVTTVVNNTRMELSVESNCINCLAGACDLEKNECTGLCASGHGKDKHGNCQEIPSCAQSEFNAGVRCVPCTEALSHCSICFTDTTCNQCEEGFSLSAINHKCH